MEISRREDAITRFRSDGTEVVYHIFGEYEVHFNVLRPGLVQRWHSHRSTEETICPTVGVLRVHTRESEGSPEEIFDVSPGDLVRMGDTIHTLSNPGKDDIQFIALRLVLVGEDHQDMFIEDKQQH